MAYQQIIVRSISEYISRVIEFSEDEGDIWYRGHKLHSYNLEPPAYRCPKFREEGEGIERRSILAAKSDMLHIVETRRLRKRLEWLCYLQHNRLPTRLLDWSSEFHIALYFAFEDYLKGKATPGSLPCVWSIKPKAFTEGLVCYINENERTAFGLEPEEQSAVIELLERNDTQGTRVIAKFDKSRRCLNNIYVPFVSPFVNERAKMQGGCFIRFPLLNSMKESEFNKYKLDKFILGSPCFTNCLAKFVFIFPRKNIRELTILNLNTSRVYPEVENIALGIKNRLFED